jgi:hypothetical protein
MKIVYIGPFSHGELANPETGQGYPFKRGVSTSVPDSFGAMVLAGQDKESPQWVDEGNPLADEAAERAAALMADASEQKE